MYRAAGGEISEECTVGIDPLVGDSNKQSTRHAVFSESYKFNCLFSAVVDGDRLSLKEAILFFIDITYRLSI